MSKESTLEVNIPCSLVAAVKQAAQRYRATPDRGRSAALESYVTALEVLADYVSSRSPVPIDGSARAEQIRRAAPARAHSRAGSTVIPFRAASAGSGWPFTAA